MGIVVIINGFPRSGKDTVVDFTREYLGELLIDVAAFSSIDPIRKILMEIGVPVEKKGPKERLLLHEMKASLDRYHNFATDLAVKTADQFMRDARKDVVFVHAREPDAIRYMKAKWDSDSSVEVLTVLVERPGTEVTDTNAADDGVRGYDYDITIRNTGSLEDLRSEALRLATKIRYMHMEQI